MFETVMEQVGNFSNIAGAISGFAALIGVMKLLRDNARMSEKVEVVLRLVSGERQVELPLELLRRDVTRAELFGRLGAIPMRERGKRFAINSLSTPDFYRALNKVVDGTTNELVIAVTNDELDQFDI